VLALTITGHSSLADWSFLIALVAFALSAVLAVLGDRRSAPEATTGGARAPLVRALTPIGLAFVALGLLVI
jgi:hypothetical protein